MKAPQGLPILFLLVATGCSTSRHTVGEGPFQKRTLRPGWHLDLGLRRDQAPMQRSRTPEQLTIRGLDPAIPSGEPAYAALEATGLNGPAHTLLPRPKGQPDPVAGAPRTTAEAPAPTLVQTVPLDEPKPRWNPLAIPAFALAVGTVAYAILGTSELVVVLAVVATLVLAAIAVRKGRTYEWRGKGFAVVALMIGALAGLITLVALLAG
jgi:hypothetical protein